MKEVNVLEFLFVSSGLINALILAVIIKPNILREYLAEYFGANN